MHCTAPDQLKLMVSCGRYIKLVNAAKVPRIHGARREQVATAGWHASSSTGPVAGSKKAVTNRVMEKSETGREYVGCLSRPERCGEHI